MSAFDTSTGTVVSFDEHRGYGAVADATGVEWPFHCTAIAGGERTIDVGRAVRFTVVPGRLGRWEATKVEPLGLGESPTF
jgi:cold shock CspA family protein